MPQADFTPAESPPTRHAPSPAVAAKPRSNLYFRLASARPARGFDPPRCPPTCRSPAIHGKLRHRMHSVRSPACARPKCPGGARRPHRVRDARTIHRNGAKAHADNLLAPYLLRAISRVDIALDRYRGHLPTAPSANRLAARNTADAQSNRAVQTIPY